jgi:hypothetical protein
MKNKLFLAAMAALSMLFVAPAAQAQANFQKQITNYASITVAGANQTTFGTTTNQLVSIRQNRGSSWLLKVHGTNSVTTGNLTIGFDVTADGTNWTSAQPLQWTVALNGTNRVTYWTNFSIASLSNVRYVFPTLATNANTSTNAIVIDFLQESHASD